MQISGLSASNTFSATDVLAIEVNENGTNKTYKLTGATLATALASIGSYLKTTDVVDNLTSTATDKPLSAAQGKALNDNIAKYTSNANGEAWQFASGLMICVKTVTQPVSWSAWGSLYESEFIDYGSFPINFISIPVVSVSLNDSLTAAMPVGAGSISVSSAGGGKVIRPNNPGNQPITVGIIAIGRWK